MTSNRSMHKMEQKGNHPVRQFAKSILDDQDLWSYHIGNNTKFVSWKFYVPGLPEQKSTVVQSGVIMCISSVHQVDGVSGLFEWFLYLEASCPQQSIRKDCSSM